MSSRIDAGDTAWMIVASVFSFGGSLLLYKFVDLMLNMRVRDDQEERGMDLSQHGENI